MPGMTADDLDEMEAHEAKEAARREENKTKYKPVKSEVSIVAKLKGVKVANSVRVAGTDATFFKGEEDPQAPHLGFKVHLLSNGLVRIVSRAKPLEPVFVPVMNCVYFVADDFNVSF